MQCVVDQSCICRDLACIGVQLHQCVRVVAVYDSVVASLVLFACECLNADRRESSQPRGVLASEPEHDAWITDIAGHFQWVCAVLDCLRQLS
jgi:hypothetical protein